MAKRLPRYLEANEVHQLRDACDGRDRLLVECLWMTGGRISEVLAMRKSDIRKRYIRLPNLKQHGGPAEKAVFVSDAGFLERLNAYTAKLKGDALLFPNRKGRALSRVQGWRIVKKAAREAGLFRRHTVDGILTPAWPHTLRHSYAVHLLSNSVPITAVRDQLGHSSLKSTEVYTALSDPAKERAIAGVIF